MKAERRHCQIQKSSAQKGFDNGLISYCGIQGETCGAKYLACRCATLFPSYTWPGCCQYFQLSARQKRFERYRDGIVCRAKGLLKSSTIHKIRELLGIKSLRSRQADVSDTSLHFRSALLPLKPKVKHHNKNSWDAGSSQNISKKDPTSNEPLSTHNENK